MKQIVGYLLIICCVPILLYFGSEIWEEIATSNQQEQLIEQSIDLPEMASQLPFTLVDQNGDVFSEEYVEWTQPLALDAIPKIVKELFLYSEDVDFYSHIGFDVTAIARAVVANSSEQSIQQGGSTITQQLVRMRYLSEEKTYERKLMELFYAYELEQAYDKDQILEMYLNEIYFSNQVYGIGGAATYYFDKPLAQLTLAETAFIAAIPNNPKLYDPLKNFDNTKSRQERLIDKLAEHQIITLAEADTHKAEPITLSIKNKIQKSPAYSTYALQELKWLIAAQDGYEERLANATTTEQKEQITAELKAKTTEILRTGIIIHTALDPEKQASDEARINEILTVDELQASATVIDNTTREIVSIYGGKNYGKFDLHRAFQAPRQPGSSFKPLSVYAPFFETTTNSASTIVNGGHYCIGSFCPKNYGGGVYGNVTISTAFKYSYNTSALRLFNTVGVATVFNYLDQFSFRSITKDDRTYAAALGGLTYGVTTLEMADAYTSFIDGSYKPARSIRKVTDLAGNTLYSWPTKRVDVWSPATVKTMRSLLSGVVSGGTGVGLYSSSSSYLGAKTGTTNDYKDFWLSGLSDQYTTSVWIGYDQPRSMERLERSRIHFSIFNTIMN